MNCPKCGAPLAPNAHFCGVCGTPVQEIPPVQQPAASQYGAPVQQPAAQEYPPMQQPAAPVQPALLSRAEFDQHPLVKKCRGNILGSAIVMYICAAITLLATVLLANNLFGLIDVAILAGLGLGVQLGRSRVCAVIACVYSVINMLITLITTHQVGGYLMVIAAIYAVLSTFQYAKAWKTYQLTGQFPASRKS